MTFASDLKGFSKKSKRGIDSVVRQAVVLAAQGLVSKSPVGNPELWAINASHATMKNRDNRVMYNLFVDEFNASRGADEKKMRKFGKKRMAEGLKLQRSSYVGGRFKSNWQYGVGSPDATTTETVDPSGAETLARLTASASTATAGQIYYVSNSLVYARALEYGHSTQAPAGVARITFATLKSDLAKYVQSISK